MSKEMDSDLRFILERLNITTDEIPAIISYLEEIGYTKAKKLDEGEVKREALEVINNTYIHVSFSNYKREQMAERIAKAICQHFTTTRTLDEEAIKDMESSPQTLITTPKRELDEDEILGVIKDFRTRHPKYRTDKQIAKDIKRHFTAPMVRNDIIKKLQKALKGFVWTIEEYGDFDEGCLYYNKVACPELQLEYNFAKKALDEIKQLNGLSEG